MKKEFDTSPRLAVQLVHVAASGEEARMGTVTYMNPEQALKQARDEEVLRGRQLLVAAQQYYDGEIQEEEFLGYVCRYGHACLSRRVIRHEAQNLAADTNGLN